MSLTSETILVALFAVGLMLGALALADDATSAGEQHTIQEITKTQAGAMGAESLISFGEPEPTPTPTPELTGKVYIRLT